MSCSDNKNQIFQALILGIGLAVTWAVGTYIMGNFSWIPGVAAGTTCTVLEIADSYQPPISSITLPIIGGITFGVVVAGAQYISGGYVWLPSILGGIVVVVGVVVANKFGWRSSRQ